MRVPEIAHRLSRLPSTIYPELKRNTYQDAELPQYSGYYAVTVPDKYVRSVSS
jgi:IS30 family transposase